MGVSHFKFKKSMLASSVAAACYVAPLSAVAEEPIEEVVVSGIRGSVQRAQDIKRESTGVVDAISAEDIGKMPDGNIAESLQRIPGLSIDRTNGEGARVTIRGIDPAKNMVTLNGRNMPATTNNLSAGDNASRAFDFANIASESIAGVEVYKTGRADITGGGLGGTINMKTIRPLDLGETKASIGAKALQDTSVHRSQTGGEEFTPEASGLFSWVNEDETFGVTLAGSYQERDNHRSFAFVNNWNLVEHDASDPSWADGAAITNAPANGESYAYPTDLRYAIADVHRERENAQLTVQWKPIERLTGTVDYLYSEFDADVDVHQQSTWYNFSSAVDALTFDEGQQVATPVIYSEAYPGAGKDVSFAQQDFKSVSENTSLGINLEYQVLDNFTLELDYHDSRADTNTTRTEIGLNANVVTSEYSDWRGDLPIMGVTIDDSDPTKGNDNGVLDGGDVSSAMGSSRWDTQGTAIEQLQLNGVLDLGGFAFVDESSVEFGFGTRTDTNHTRMNKGEAPRITMGNWGGVDPDTFGPDWPNYFTFRDFGESFPDYGSSTGDDRFLDFGLDGHFDNIKENIEWVYAQGVDPGNFNNFPNGKIQANTNVDLDRLIEEEVSSYYAQYHANMDLGGMEANLVVGVRQESTDVTSSALVKIPSNISWDGDDDHSLVPGSGLTESYQESNSYDNFLPNVDFDISVMENMKVRASFSETIARPGYDDLQADFTIDSIINRQASAGNPMLEPLESKNFDISFEWYYGEDSMMSVGYFTKDVTNFIGSGVVPAGVYGLRDIRNGPRAQAAAATVGGTDDLDAWHDQLLTDIGLDPTDETTSVVGVLSGANADPVMQWDVTRPTNQNDLSVDGLELSLTQWFGESGFGVTANYTLVDSDDSIDPTSDEEQSALIGVSDTANLMGFYDKHGLQARITYNWRDSYLTSTTQGGNNAPGYVEAYSQIDFSVSYDVTENVVLSLEGLNVTGENTRTYGRSQRQMFEMEDLGARYQVGARYNF